MNHVVDLETFAFNRHADIRKPLDTPRPVIRDYLDFPRHGGFYIHLWTTVYRKTGAKGQSQLVALILSLTIF